MKSFAELLWGKQSKAIYLFIASAVLLLTCLGSHELWTQEHRWADIVSGMFYRHDFLHPYLNQVNYYDKPLLSYWLIAGVSFLSELSIWALRLPSALAGILAVWSIYQLGTLLKNRRLGLLAGWALLTTYYFVFWARISSADMLNVAGILFAVYWYFASKSRPNFVNYSIFFLILALTALCKGLVGIMVPLIAILPDLLANQEWKKHLHFKIVLAVIPAAIMYVLPFWASAHFGSGHYEQNGLYLVYRENILRYFQPFDHKDPIYAYFIFLPLYLLPWTLFFIPTLFTIKSRWRNMTWHSKWMIWVVALLFIFFTLSGSRRNYYILPVVPFAILMTADWILGTASDLTKRNRWAGRLAAVFFMLLFLNFGILQPLYYAQGGLPVFAEEVKTFASSIKPWSEWQFVMLNAESKSRFYLKLSPEVKNLDFDQPVYTEISLIEAWPILKNKNPNIIFITKKEYEPMLKNILPNYTIIEAKPILGEKLFGIDNKNRSVAFIPKR